jgi:serine/threonine protein phosphatase 1
MMSNVLEFDVENSRRVIFVSDIHGEIDWLLHGLKQIDFKIGHDVCICIGDLIDRGSNSYKTAKFFLDDTSGSFFASLGNHDVFTFSNDPDLWIYNGGYWAFTELDDTERLLLGQELSTLPYAIEVTHKGKVFGCVHASVPYEFTSWEDFVDCLENDNAALKKECVWDRNFIEYHNNPHYNTVVEGVDFTIHGHTPIKQPMIIGNRVHIDTGLVYGKYLTLAEFVDSYWVFHKVVN